MGLQCRTFSIVSAVLLHLKPLILVLLTCRVYIFAGSFNFRLFSIPNVLMLINIKVTEDSVVTDSTYNIMIVPTTRKQLYNTNMYNNSGSAKKVSTDLDCGYEKLNLHKFRKIGLFQIDALKIKTTELLEVNTAGMILANDIQHVLSTKLRGLSARLVNLCTALRYIKPFIKTTTNLPTKWQEQNVFVEVDICNCFSSSTDMLRACV